MPRISYLGPRALPLLDKLPWGEPVSCRGPPIAPPNNHRRLQHHNLCNILPPGALLDGGEHPLGERREVWRKRHDVPVGHWGRLGWGVLVGGGVGMRRGGGAGGREGEGRFEDGADAVELQAAGEGGNLVGAGGFKVCEWGIGGGEITCGDSQHTLERKSRAVVDNIRWRGDHVQ